MMIRGRSLKEWLLLAKDHGIRGAKNPEVWKFLGISAFASLLITVLALYLSSMNYATGLFPSYFMNPVTFFFNFLPVYVFTVVMAMLFRSLRIAVALNGIFWFSLALANTIKILYRHSTLRPEDFALLKPMLKIAPQYMKDVDMKLVAMAGVGLVVFLIFARLMPKINFRPTTRIFAAIVFIAIGTLSVNVVYADTPLYKAQYKQNEARWADTSGITYRLHSDRYQANGLMYSFSYWSQFHFGFSNENYDSKRAQELVDARPEQMIPEGKKIHVITILLESFKDFSPEALPSTLQMTEDPYVPFHQLMQQCYGGTMISDVYGGGTINIETAVLSGLYKQPNYINHPGWTNVHYLRQNGYSTVAMHPNDGYFYSRHDRYPNEGFQNFLYTQNHYHNSLSTYMKDADLLNDTLDVFDRYKKNGPLFFYLATMEGHGPYNVSSINEREWFPYQEGTSRRAYNMLNNYFSTLYNTGQALLDFTTALDQEEEPVVVVFFGDHSPSVEPGGYDILGLKAPDGTVQAKLNNYATPYGIWGNQAAKTLTGQSFTGQAPTIDPQMMLSNVLYRYLGWKGSANDQYMQELGESLTSQKRDFWHVDGQSTVTYPRTKIQALKDLQNINIFFREKKMTAEPQIDERSDDKRYEQKMPPQADPDSSANAATKSQTGNARGR